MNTTGAGGRPTKYKKSFNIEAQRLTMLGLINDDLATYFGVNVDTIHEWKKRYPKFSDAIRAGKESADGKVVAALFKAALGQTYDEVVYEKLDEGELMAVNGGGELSEMKTDIFKKKVTTKKLPGDVRAQQFWLKNRQPGKWRDKTEVDNTVTVKEYSIGFTKNEGAK